MAGNSDNYEATGTVKAIGEETTHGAKGFRKREIVVTIGEKYPQDVPFEFVQDKCGILDGFSVGQSVTVSFNLRGREWNGRYYAGLQGWRIAHHGDATQQPAETTTAAASDNTGDDGLPF